MALVESKLTRNAVKGVKVEIPLNFVLEDKSEVPLAPSEYIYDYLIDSDLVVCGLEVTKTINNLAPGDAGTLNGGAITVTVQKIPYGSLSSAVAEDISKATLANGLGATVVKGKKSIAGVGAASSANFAFDFAGAGSTTLDPVQKVSANAGTGSQTRQRIRIVIALTQAQNRAADTDSYSCFVNVTLVSCGQKASFGQGVYFEAPTA